MATQTLNFPGSADLGIDKVELSVAGVDAVDDTDNSPASFATVKGRWTAQFSGKSGVYLATAYVGALEVWNDLFDLVDTASVFFGRSEAAVQVGGIADAVWDEAEAGHNTPGTFGASISSSNTVGPGGTAWPLRVTSGGIGVPGVKCWITTTSSPTAAVVAGVLITDDDGWVTLNGVRVDFMLDTGVPYWLHRNSGTHDFPVVTFTL